MEEVIDLSFDLFEGMLTFGAHWHVPFEMTQLGRHGVEGRETRKITFGTHTGTQVDAPLHFIPNGMSIESVPLTTLVGPVKIFDFTAVPEFHVISEAEVKKLDLGPRVLFKFGWEKHWPNKKYYSGYPCFSQEAAQYMVKSGVKLVGFDCPSPDDSRTVLAGNILGSNEDSPIHKIFLGNNVILVEYLANLDKVKNLIGWNIAALPLRIRGADGSPARVILFR
jgi:arylformamidase